MTAPNMEGYSRTFSSFSGADIVATFNGRLIGELQAISYSVVREVAPIYTMGSPDPRSFSRGKRGISGSLIFTQFDRDALMDEMKKQYQGAPVMQTFQQFVANSSQFENAIISGLKGTERGYGVKAWDDVMTQLGYANVSGAGEFDDSAITGFYTPEYADQLMPFNIAISMANEFGQRAGMEIYGLQILNEGSGFSVDDVVTAKAYTWVARKVKGVTPKENLRSEGGDSYNGTVGNYFKNLFA
ncbi:hypothetical protein SAMN02799624_05440 [Paenibacillus sp. UNC496MF]|uniref:hypothetical protein n=1 Tax=Paenibacillus sp. UNC496MF TaxID=1502753 RepID=UPI0008E49BBA|nr:hypothetical protein [Paenibacillus sp. UNC496MF]SFJ66214.1 hypothetical protein SAMN02799624_05440 [Paenibacillus sp. UNC496MF]